MAPLGAAGKVVGWTRPPRRRRGAPHVTAHLLVAHAGRPEDLARLVKTGGVVSGVLAEDDPRRLVSSWLSGYDNARTRWGYAADLAAWLNWCASYGYDPLRAQPAYVQCWAQEAERAGTKPSTITRRVAALSSWYRYLASHGQGGRVRINGVVSRPLRGRSTTGLSPGDACKLLTAADCDRGPQSLRTGVVVRLLMHAGLGVDELLRADVADLGHDGRRRTLAVQEASGRAGPRTVALASDVGAALDIYLADRAHHAGLDDVDDLKGPLVATRTGHPLDPDAVWKLITRLARAAGIPPASPRTLTLTSTQGHPTRQ